MTYPIAYKAWVANESVFTESSRLCTGEDEKVGHPLPIGLVVTGYGVVWVSTGLYCRANGRINKSILLWLGINREACL